MTQLDFDQIKNICSEITGITQLNTFFLSANGKKGAEFYHAMPPIILQDYFDHHTKKFIPPCHFHEDEHAITMMNQCDMHFIIIPLKHQSINQGHLFVGPFLFEEPTNQRVQDVIFRLNLPHPLHHAFKQYFYSMDILTEAKVTYISKCILRMCLSLEFPAEKYNIHLYREDQETALPYLNEITTFDTQHHIELIERRYANENALYHAVENGDFKAASSIIFDNQFMFKFLERVPNNPLRSHKNLFFVYNALLRKAAEKGGVHPIYTDSVSGKFAILIERVNTITDFGQLYSKMLYEYCDLVKTHSLKNYSKLISQVVEYIRLNLDQPINLDVLATLFTSSSSTISRRFKEEVGEGMPDYINRLRIQEAIHLLEHKNYSLTQIALKIGYNDINYFTKIFKKIKGMTPSEYKRDLD